MDEFGQHRNVWGTLDRRHYAGRKYPEITAVYKQLSIKVLMVAPDIAVLSVVGEEKRQMVTDALRGQKKEIMFTNKCKLMNS